MAGSCLGRDGCRLDGGRALQAGYVNACVPLPSRSERAEAGRGACAPRGNNRFGNRPRLRLWSWGAAALPPVETAPAPSSLPSSSAAAASSDPLLSSSTSRAITSVNSTTGTTSALSIASGSPGALEGAIDSSVRCAPPLRCSSLAATKCPPSLTPSAEPVLRSGPRRDHRVSSDRAAGARSRPPPAPARE